ncbi:hypothetical protein PIB30_090484 [Stylosanthes scabra]|uniref:Uncharacterized protein n=1 Tax=Stylosanthes scabra TaxID=79078 RepID=A0ABU6YRZ7_9FABA|nr:hypothetical protein [Stylosanthes scabra]
MASSSSAGFDAHRFRSPFHQMRTEEEIAEAEAHPYESYVRGVEIDFSVENIKQILRIGDHTPGAESDSDTRQRSNQRLDEGDDVRAEELIADNIIITVEQPQGRPKLIFPSTIYRLCKEAEVSLREFRGSELISVDKAITARVMVRTRGRHIDYHQNQQVEEEEEQIQQPENENEAEYENQAEEEQPTMHFEATNAGFQNNFGEQQQQQGFQQLNEELSNMEMQQMDPIEKMEERIHQQHNEIIEMRSQIKEWTKNASSREAYCCWAHQQANPNLVQIPIHDIPKFAHDNATKGRHIFQGALKTHEQGESSQSADVPMAEPEKE